MWVQSVLLLFWGRVCKAAATAAHTAAAALSAAALTAAAQTAATIAAESSSAITVAASAAARSAAAGSVATASDAAASLAGLSAVAPTSNRRGDPCWRCRPLPLRHPHPLLLCPPLPGILHMQTLLLAPQSRRRPTWWRAGAAPQNNGIL